MHGQLLLTKCKNTRLVCYLTASRQVVVHQKLKLYRILGGIETRNTRELYNIPSGRLNHCLAFSKRVSGERFTWIIGSWLRCILTTLLTFFPNTVNIKCGRQKWIILLVFCVWFRPKSLSAYQEYVRHIYQMTFDNI